MATSEQSDTHLHEKSDAEISQSEARNRCLTEIKRAYRDKEDLLITGLMSLGKSFGSIQAASEVGNKITILTGRGRKEQYQQFEEWCSQHELSYHVLPSFPFDCSTARGTYDDRTSETVLELYHRGVSPSTIHEHRSLPCEKDGKCPYREKMDVDFGDYDVLIGHYNHAHIPDATRNRTVVIDEFPGDAYETKVGSERIPQIVTHYLQSREGIPFEDYADLMANRDKKSLSEEAIDQLLDTEKSDLRLSDEELLEDPEANKIAPSVVYILLAAQKLENGWGKVDFPWSVEKDDLVGYEGAYDGGANEIYLLRPPNLCHSRNVVGLDGTANPLMWEYAINLDLQPTQILSERERRSYVKSRYDIILSTEAIKSYNGRDVIPGQDANLLRCIRQREGQKPALITSKTALNEYDSADVDVSQHYLSCLHYGNVLGSNDYAKTRVGAVIGAQHYGDQFIQKWGAYTGQSLEREGKGVNLTYGDFGDQFLSHMYEHETIQAVMRFGRDGNGTTVYVHTNTLPDWVPVTEQIEIHECSDGELSVVEALRDLRSAKTREVKEHPSVSISERQVREHLKKLVRHNYVSCRTEGRGHVFSDICLEDLSAVEFRNSHV